LAGHARQVGYALHSLPDTTDVPWHRVINAKGEISARSDPGYEFIQHDMLQAEGVIFDLTGKIDMKRFRWIPHDAD
jgi:methylated-DNA-protein-cysteine methyltransferase-like protein